MKRLVAKGAGLAERRSAALPPHQQEGVRRESRDRGLPRSELEFPGCYARPMTRAQYEAHEGRVEFFDSRAGIAWMVREPPSAGHEAPSRTLGQLLARIAMVRGAPIQCLGATDLRLLDAASGQLRVLQPDELVYLDPAGRDAVGSGYWKAGEDPYPDVILEVDHTTDVRRSKLGLYEEWGFPELWVEVPDAYSPSRPAGLRSGLRIHLLEAGAYAPSEESRAFPGWRAAEIHRGLNEPFLSEETLAVVSRVGRALGEREGTGPEDDPMLREQRIEGRAEGFSEGLAEGRTAERADVIPTLLRGKGIAVAPDFPEDLPSRCLGALGAASWERILAAASPANSFADFLARLEDPGS